VFVAGGFIMPFELKSGVSKKFKLCKKTIAFRLLEQKPIVAQAIRICSPAAMTQNPLL
jgi:hypothetical protein